MTALTIKSLQKLTTITVKMKEDASTHSHNCFKSNCKKVLILVKLPQQFLSTFSKGTKPGLKNHRSPVDNMLLNLFFHNHFKLNCT